MKINIVPRQLDLTRSLEDFTAEKFAALEAFCADVLVAHGGSDWWKEEQLESWCGTRLAPC